MAAIRDGMERGLHLGAQVYVSLGGEVKADEAVGVARPAREGEPALPMTPETIVAWMSGGKPVTAVAVGRCGIAGYWRSTIRWRSSCRSLGCTGKIA